MNVHIAAEGWLADTRASYDTVAADYADVVRGFLAGAPYDRAILALFAELAGDGPVLDAGCGPGHVTAYLNGLGADAFGLDLSPGMIEVARRDHPVLRFAVGSMTALGLAGASVAGVIAWYSLIHVPDDEIAVVLAEFRRVLRPGGVVLLGFHDGDGSRLKTEGYGGHPMKVHVHRRRPERVAAWLDEAGFTVEAQLLQPAHAALFARSRPASTS